MVGKSLPLCIMIITICIKKNCLKGSSARLGGAAFLSVAQQNLKAPVNKNWENLLTNKEKHWIIFSKRKIKWQLFYKFE